MATDVREASAAELAGESARQGARGGATPASSASAIRGAWARMGARERRLVTVLGAIAAALLIWVLAIRPAWTAVNDSAKRLPELDAQIEDMQRLATESRELRGAARLQPSQATAALRTASDALGAAGKLTLAGERATLTLTNASGEQIQRWLVDARTTARARTIEAKLTRAAAGYSGTIIVTLPAAS